MASNYRLADTMAFVSPFLNFYPLTLGSSSQPFVGMCTAVAQVILAPPFRHNFNRNTVNFLTKSGVQTYVNTNSWNANYIYTLGTTIIDPNGNGQKVIVAGTSSSYQPTWSTGIFTTTNDDGGSPPSSLTWQNVGPLVSISQITDFGFIEKAMVQDINNGNVWKELGVSLDLSRDTTPSCPKYISAQTDDNLGDVAVRLMPPPGGVYPVSMQYQKLQVPFTSVAQTWAPIPDRMFMIYSFGVLALAYLYKGDSRFQWASMQFVTKMLAYAEGLSETQINQFLRNWQLTTSENTWNQKAQQGTAARGQG